MSSGTCTVEEHPEGSIQKHSASRYHQTISSLSFTPCCSVTKTQLYIGLLASHSKFYVAKSRARPVKISIKIKARLFVLTSFQRDLVTTAGNHIRCGLGGGEILFFPVGHQLLSSSTAKHKATTLTLLRLPGRGHLEVLYLNLAEYFIIHPPNTTCPHPQMRLSLSSGHMGVITYPSADISRAGVPICPRPQCLSHWHRWYPYHEDYTLLLLLLLVLLLLLLKSQLKHWK